MDTRIQQLIKNHREIYNYLLNLGEVSFANDIDLYYKKILVFSCASLFENLICNEIYDVAKNKSPMPIAEFIRNKAIERQYHTYFNWKECKTSSINGFLGLWGDDFKTTFANKIKSDIKLNKGVIAFIKIGNERNLMAHENFIEYSPAMTFAEVESLYGEAEYFVDKLLQELRNINNVN